MDDTRLRTVNDHGLGMAGKPGERLKDFYVYAEGGSVQVWVEVMSSEGDTPAVMQYMDPLQAMAFAKAFERCAILALHELAKR